MKKYTYFVSYAHDGGFGNVEITTNNIITSAYSLENELWNENKEHKNKVVLYFKLLYKEEVPENFAGYYEDNDYWRVGRC